MKNPLTPAAIEPATFPIVAQHLNHCATTVPLGYVDSYKYQQQKTYLSSYNESQQDALFLNFILVKDSTCFGQTYYPSTRVSILYSKQLVFVTLVMLPVR